MSRLETPPEKLIDEKGRVQFGVFNSPVKNLNLDRFDYQSLGRFPSSLFSSTAKLAKKRWQYLGVFDENIVVGVAVIHLGYIGSGFAYVYQKDSGKLTEINLIDPLARNTVYSESSISGFSAVRMLDMTIKMANDPTAGPRRMEVDAPDMKIFVDVPDDEDKFSPLAVCTRNGLRGFNYTHKAAGLPALGYVEVDGRRIDLQPGALGVLDWTAGTAARETFWNWASAAGRIADDKIVGINFASGINETAYTENVIWLDGKPTKVDVVHFDYDYKDPMKPWKITSSDGKVDLTFHPEGERKENQNYLVVASKFRQPFGRFEGKLKAGKTLNIDSLYGFVEEHYVRW